MCTRTGQYTVFLFDLYCNFLEFLQFRIRILNVIKSTNYYFFRGFHNKNKPNYDRNVHIMVLIIYPYIYIYIIKNIKICIILYFMYII